MTFGFIFNNLFYSTRTGISQTRSTRRSAVQRRDQMGAMMGAGTTALAAEGS